MGQSDFRLDAYRIISDNLRRVRAVLRQALEQLHGPHWEAVIEPMDRRTFLAQRREREISINWRRATADDLLEYGNFSDLYEFVAADKRLLERFATVARDEEVLRLRFLEIDSIFNRVAYARPISESEMELLINFDERLRRLGDGATVAQEIVGDVPVHPPLRETSPAPSMPPAQGFAAAPTAPTPSPAAQPPSRPHAAPTNTPAAPTPATPSPPPPPVPPSAVSPSRMKEALQAGDEVTVLTGLYGEVTAIADGLWSDTSCPSPRLWEMVRESTWYSENFTPLGLKPLSDFYDLAHTARGRLLDGMSRKQLQDFLKEHNFAQILLALRDLFRSRLPSRPPN
jgi:hypothetical protein